MSTVKKRGGSNQNQTQKIRNATEEVTEATEKLKESLADIAQISKKINSRKPPIPPAPNLSKYKKNPPPPKYIQNAKQLDEIEQRARTSAEQTASALNKATEQARKNSNEAERLATEQAIKNAEQNTRAVAEQTASALNKATEQARKNSNEAERLATEQAIRNAEQNTREVAVQTASALEKATEQSRKNSNEAERLATEQARKNSNEAERLTIEQAIKNAEQNTRVVAEQTASALDKAAEQTRKNSNEAGRLATEQAIKNAEQNTRVVAEQTASALNKAAEQARKNSNEVERVDAKAVTEQTERELEKAEQNVKDAAQKTLKNVDSAEIQAGINAIDEATYRYEKTVKEVNTINHQNLVEKMNSAIISGNMDEIKSEIQKMNVINDTYIDANKKYIKSLIQSVTSNKIKQKKIIGGSDNGGGNNTNRQVIDPGQHLTNMKYIWGRVIKTNNKYIPAIAGLYQGITRLEEVYKTDDPLIVGPIEMEIITDMLKIIESGEYIEDIKKTIQIIIQNELFYNNDNIPVLENNTPVDHNVFGEPVDITPLNKIYGDVTNLQTRLVRETDLMIEYIMLCVDLNIPTIMADYLVEAYKNISVHMHTIVGGPIEGDATREFYNHGLEGLRELRKVQHTRLQELDANTLKYILKNMEQSFDDKITNFLSKTRILIQFIFESAKLEYNLCNPHENWVDNFNPTDEETQSKDKIRLYIETHTENKSPDYERFRFFLELLTQYIEMKQHYFVTYHEICQTIDDIIKVIYPTLQLEQKIEDFFKDIFEKKEITKSDLSKKWSEIYVNADELSNHYEGDQQIILDDIAHTISIIILYIDNPLKDKEHQEQYDYYIARMFQFMQQVYEMFDLNQSLDISDLINSINGILFADNDLTPFNVTEITIEDLALFKFATIESMVGKINKLKTHAEQMKTNNTPIPDILKDYINLYIDTYIHAKPDTRYGELILNLRNSQLYLDISSINNMMSDLIPQS